MDPIPARAPYLVHHCSANLLDFDRGALSLVAGELCDSAADGLCAAIYRHSGTLLVGD